MSDEVFVVVKRGIYIQDILGPFPTVALAKEAAQTAAAHDDGYYHTWEVRPLRLQGWDDVEDPLAIYVQDGGRLERGRGCTKVPRAKG